jgi:hypothetical protein
MMQHALQCREPDWSSVFDTDRNQAAQSRRRFLGEVAVTSTLILPIHFPNPTVGLSQRMANAFATFSSVKSGGNAFNCTIEQIIRHD